MSGLYVLCLVLRLMMGSHNNNFLGNTKHQEIFSFERVMEGRYKGKEWEEIVKAVIEKWGGFVGAYL